MFSTSVGPEWSLLRGQLSVPGNKSPPQSKNVIHTFWPHLDWVLNIEVTLHLFHIYSTLIMPIIYCIGIYTATSVWENLVLLKTFFLGMSQKVPTNFNIPCISIFLECFYLGIQVGSRGMNDILGLPRAFVTWNSMLTSKQISFWSHRGAEHLKIIQWFWDLVYFICGCVAMELLNYGIVHKWNCQYV